MPNWKVPEEIKETITDAWLSMRNTGTEPSARQVLDEVQAALLEEGYKNLRLPGTRKTQEIIKEAKEYYDESPSEYTELDRAWCVGDLNWCHQIAADALPAILGILKDTLSSNSVLTVREVKWIARLHTVISDTQELLFFAQLYAKRERTGWFSQEFGTADIDTALIMGPWELSTARLLDKVAPPLSPSVAVLHRPSSLGIQGQNAMGVAKGAERNLWTRWYLHNIHVNLNELWALLPELDELNYTEQALRVYTYWVKHIGEHEKLSEMSPNEVVDVVIALRQWTVGHEWNSAEDDSIPVAVSKRKAQSFDELEPTEVLSRVGK